MTTGLFFAFLWQCVVVGASISIDIFFATVANYKRHLTVQNWVWPVAITHTLFPAAGYFAVWVLGSFSLYLQVCLGILGFVLVVLFLYEEISEKIGIDPQIHITEYLERYTPVPKIFAANYALALSVSWDALAFGPASEAIPEAQAWPLILTLLFFPLIGIVVALLTWRSLLAAQKLREVHYQKFASFATLHVWGDVLAYSVIGGFGVLALWQGFSQWLGDGSPLRSTLIATVIVTAIFVLFRKRIMATEYQEAHKALD